MKLITTLLSILISLSFYAQAPNWQFAQLGDGTGKDSGREIVIDSQGNVYVLGGFRDSDMTIQGVTLTNAGNDDAFLAKFAAAGNLLWAKSIGGSKSDGAGGLVIDKNDDIYISGSFRSPTLIIGTTTLTNPDTSFYPDPVFIIAKYNSAGQVLWVKGDNNSILSSGIRAVDDDLNYYSITRTSTTTSIEKYDSSENLLWSTQLSTTGTISTIYSRGFHVDSTGVYITGGFFGNTLTIGGVTLINNIAQNSDDMYIAKLDMAGNVLWAKNAQGLSSDHGTKVAVDQLGNIYVLGQFTGNATFDAHTITTNGGSDLFLTKYTPQGQVIWAKNAGGSENDWVSGLALDENGGAYITGEFYSPSITFANTTFNNQGVWYSYADIFILKYDSSGNEVWIKNIEGLGNDNGNGIAVNSLGEVYVTGAIEDTLGGVINVGGFSLLAAGLDDFFFGKLASTVGVDEQVMSNSPLVYPNPTNGQLYIKLENRSHEKVMLKLYDVVGKLVITQNYQSQTEGEQQFSLNIVNLKEGTYLYTLQIGEQITNGKIVKIK